MSEGLLFQRVGAVVLGVVSPTRLKGWRTPGVVLIEVTVRMEKRDTNSKPFVSNCAHIWRGCRVGVGSGATIALYWNGEKSYGLG
jgi:hypothetical protein